MSKQQKEQPKVKEEPKKPAEPQKAHKKEPAAPAEPQGKPGDTITQPDPNDKQSQEYIRENARRGESVHVPNVIGPDAVTEEV